MLINGELTYPFCKVLQCNVNGYQSIHTIVRAALATSDHCQLAPAFVRSPQSTAVFPKRTLTTNLTLALPQTRSP